MSLPSDERPAGLSAPALAWVPLPDERAFEATGADRLDFLHRMLTQDVRGIPVGSGRPALLLTPRGRILGDPFVWRLEDRLVLVLSARAAEATIPALERYVIADDVTLRDASREWGSGILLGEGAPPPGATLAPVPFGVEPARRALLPSAAEAAFERGLRDAGAAELEGASFRARRVAAGAPWFGDELDERILPNEAGLDAWISFSKGCYVGQEPVVMARHRGRPPTRLVRATIETGATPERDAPLLLDGKPAGRVTSTVRPGVGVPLLALAFVRWELAVAGRELTLADGRTVRLAGAV